MYEDLMKVAGNYPLCIGQNTHERYEGPWAPGAPRGPRGSEGTDESWGYLGGLGSLPGLCASGPLGTQAPRKAGPTRPPQHPVAEGVL